MNIEFPESACCLLAHHNHEIVLVEQWRRIHKQMTHELPGGIINEGEKPEEAVMRELREETGLLLSEVDYIFTLDMDFSVTKHKTHLFYGQAKNVIAQYSPESQIQSVKFMSINQAVEMVFRSEITHAPTVASIFWYIYRMHEI